METASHIWSDGEFVPWDDANVHFLSHALHYGTGVFEGIRAYNTPEGTAVFRLHDHMRRLDASARSYGIPMRWTVEQWDLEDELRRITVPVTMVWGGEDREAPSEVAERARGILTEAGAAVTVEVLPGVGHMVPVSAPERIGAAIDGMLG